MDNQKKNIHKSKEERCEICGNILTKGMCSNCGWVQIIFPNIVPSEIKDFNTQRKETAKKLYKEGCVSKTTIEKLEKDYNDEVSKNKTLEDSLKEEKAKKTAAEQEIGRLKGQVDKAQKELDSTKKEMQGLVDKVQSLASQKQTLTRERDNALAELERQKEDPSVSVGAQIRIAQNNGQYTLYDKSGIVRRSNGVSIGENGIVLYDGCVFQIEELMFKVKAPEFNLDNLIL